MIHPKTLLISRHFYGLESYVWRSIYNLKIETISTYYIPLDRSFLKLWNGIRHIMPSTDRRLELKEKTSMAQNAWQAFVYANGLTAMRNLISYVCMFSRLWAGRASDTVIYYPRRNIPSRHSWTSTSIYFTSSVRIKFFKKNPPPLSFRFQNLATLPTYLSKSLGPANTPPCAQTASRKVDCASPTDMRPALQTQHSSPGCLHRQNCRFAIISTALCHRKAVASGTRCGVQEAVGILSPEWLTRRNTRPRMGGWRHCHHNPTIRSHDKYNSHNSIKTWQASSNNKSGLTSNVSSVTFISLSPFVDMFLNPVFMYYLCDNHSPERYLHPWHALPPRNALCPTSNIVQTCGVPVYVFQRSFETTYYIIKVRPHRTRSAAADCGLCPLRNVTF